MVLLPPSITVNAVRRYGRERRECRLYDKSNYVDGLQPLRRQPVVAR
jgi:hypothetical protein